MLRLSIIAAVPFALGAGFALAQDAPPPPSAPADIPAAESSALETIIEEAAPADAEDVFDSAVPTPDGPATDPLAEAVSDDSGSADEPALSALTADAVNIAPFTDGVEDLKGARPLVLKLQVLLDRADISPGSIDAYWGMNVAKAVAAFELRNGFSVDGRPDPEVWTALGGDAASPVLVPYEITAEDVAGPFGDLPTDYAELAKLETLHYAGAVEMFGERFHMDPDLLMALNPGKNFSPGETILVADTGETLEGKDLVTSLRADKRNGQLLAYDEAGTLVAAYPATIGSESTPSPSGDHAVKGVATDPVYYYDPENFKQGDNTEKLELPPGPNNPVGSVWIDLTEPTYGIHGTPEPEKIDKAYSHGCVRLTNWDAEELAHLVKVGAVVSFVE
jgi:lipoprotein-anchoring transpeptidase ErfK/SrfK